MIAAWWMRRSMARLSAMDKAVELDAGLDRPLGFPLITPLDLLSRRSHNGPTQRTPPPKRRSSTHRRQAMLKFASSLVAAAILAGGTGLAMSADQPVIGLITKTDTNPFFVKMKEGATQMAKDRGARLLTAAGKQD